MDKQLDKLNEIVKAYYTTTDPHGDQLTTWMKDMSAILFYLTTEQIKSHEEWTAKMYDRGDASVASQTIKCDQEVPELYMLRKIIHAGYKNLDVMRSTLSYLKQERGSI